MTKKKEETALTAQGPNALATQEPMTGEAIEGSEQTDFQIPSAYMIKGTQSDQMIFPGVAPGSMVNTLTQEPILADTFIVLPCGYKDYQDTRPDASLQTSRNLGDWPDIDTNWDARKAAGHDGPPPVSLRLNFLVLFAGEDFPMVLRFKRTSLQVGRTLNSLFKVHKGRMLYRIRSKEAQGTKGPYIVPTISAAGPAPADLYATACSWATQLAGKDLAKIAPEIHEEAAETTADMPF